MVEVTQNADARTAALTYTRSELLTLRNALFRAAYDTDGAADDDVYYGLRDALPSPTDATKTVTVTLSAEDIADVSNGLLAAATVHYDEDRDPSARSLHRLNLEVTDALFAMGYDRSAECRRTVSADALQSAA